MASLIFLSDLNEFIALISPIVPTVYCRGAPVSIIPEEVAKKIVDESRIKDGVKIHTPSPAKNSSPASEKIPISAPPSTAVKARNAKENFK